jgi:predicted TIM-barrel enzyme
MLGYQGSVFNGGSYSSRLFIFPEARVLIRRKDMSIFKGAGVAIVTPMKENLDVNYDKLEELINFHVDNGTDAIIIAGTTGESSTLTMEEHRQVIRAAVEFTKHRIPVVAGTGSNCTRTAIQLRIVYLGLFSRRMFKNSVSNVYRFEKPSRKDETAHSFANSLLSVQ